MNIQEWYIILSTVMLYVSALFWSTTGYLNQLIKVIMFLIAVLGTMASYNILF